MGNERMHLRVQSTEPNTEPMYSNDSLNFFAAFNVFGAAGKMAIEVSMIGFLGGTCIAFFVVMGDLAPPIIAGYLGIDNTERLRIGVLLGK